MEEKTVKVGDIVLYYPSKNEMTEGKFFNKMNGAEYFPAIVTQVWSTDMVNMQIFTYDSMIVGSSIHKNGYSEINDYTCYWTFKD